MSSDKVRLVLVNTDVLDHMLSEPGTHLTTVWGEPNPLGVYEPVITRRTCLCRGECMNQPEETGWQHPRLGVAALRERDD